MSDVDISLLPDYLVEAAEHLEEMESLLLKLADEPDNVEVLDEIFRPIHSIKGAAQFIGLERSSHLAHRLEDLLDLLRKGERPSSPAVVELLIAARDLIVTLADELESSQTEISSVDEMVDQITAEIEGGVAADGIDDVEDESVQIDISTTTGGYDEEYDQELFGIFVENLREKINLVRNEIAKLEGSSDKEALLEHCTEVIRSLHSAANYMGYEELTRIYSNCLEDIAAVQEALSSNETIPYDFMDGYLLEITEIFPQLAEVSSNAMNEESSQPSDFETEVKVEADVSPEQENFDEDDDTLDVSMLPDYLVEAAEHLEEMESLLLKLADEPENIEVLDEIFRPIHSIKGAAQFIGLDRSSRLAHRLEDLLDLLRKGERPSSPAIVDLLISARDLIVKLADELENSQAEVSSVDDMVDQITAEIEADVLAGSVDFPKDVADQTNLASTTYNEENDQELFGIFVENLREKIDLVRTQIAELESSPDKVALLERCAESIQSLYSAANYMGYEDLTRIYSNCLEDIVTVQQALANNEDIPYDFLNAYLLEITALFPQLAEMPALAEVNKPHKEESTTAETYQADVEKTPEEILSEKLGKALDAAASNSEEAEYELLHGVFEEMISEQGGQQVENESDAAVSKKPETKAVTTKAVTTKAKPAQEKTKVSTKDGADKVAKVTNKIQQPKISEQDKQLKAKNDRRTDDRRSSEASVVKKSVRVEAEKIDSLINQVGELVVDRAYFFQLFDDMRGLQQHLKDDIGLDPREMKEIRAFTYRMSEAIASLSRTSNDLQEGVMKVRMLPISQLFNRYPRLVHDLTRNNNKKVNLKVEGEDTELDKMVVEKLSDPLIHVIRNAVDHGIEGSSDRISAGKAEIATLFLKSYHESNQVVVEVTDDGRGIDPVRIKEKAIEKGIVSKNEANRMLPQEIVRLITAPGFSTADEITDTSGRGVGMDVVRKNIEKLNGTLDIDSVPGKGTTIRLKIPLTLAIIPAHLVRVSGNMYTIPLANIEETLRIERSDSTIIEGTEVIYLRGKTLPIIHLTNLFSTDSHSGDQENLFVVVVNTGTQKIGLVVDELLGQEEVVIKPLVDYLRDKSGFSGATIIGDGSISLILDIYEIAQMTSSKQIKRQHKIISDRKSASTN